MGGPRINHFKVVGHGFPFLGDPFEVSHVAGAKAAADNLGNQFAATLHLAAMGGPAVPLIQLSLFGSATRSIVEEVLDHVPQWVRLWHIATVHCREDRRAK